jgi:hypothetical protein
MKGRLPISILIIILIVAYTYFGMGYLTQRQEQEALTQQIAEATQSFAKLPEPPQDLEQRLAAAQENLTAKQNAFPSKISSTEVTSNILKLANDCEVKAVPLETQPWSIEKIGEHDYQVLRLELAVEGSFLYLSQFIRELEDGKFETLIVEDLNVTTVEEQSEEETALERQLTLVTASLDLAIYTQSLTSD